jgi:hypothetical protein
VTALPLYHCTTVPPPSMSGAERLLSIRKQGSGHQYEVKWRGQVETTWEAASRVRKETPALVQEFEQQQQQQLQSSAPRTQQEGATDDDAPMLQAVVAPSVDSSMSAQMAALEQLVRNQAQQMRAQAEQLQQLRASPAHPPQQSVQPSPQLSPPAALQQSRFAKKEPRAQDLQEYDGASGAKLDGWLLELARAVRSFELNDREAVSFGLSRLGGAALQWSFTLNAAQQAVLIDVAALAAALRTRFQPVTAARTAREQLRALRQGTRGVNDYIAEFQRLHALLPDMAREDVLFAFESGLAAPLALELRKQGPTSLVDAIALAARIGGITAAAMSSSNPHGRQTAVNQMEIDDGDGASLDDRITRAVLHAMQTQQSSGSNTNASGLGAKTQTQRGYANERGGRGRGGARGGRGGRFVGLQRGPPVVPGVSPDIVRQRLDAQQCVRCGEEGHRSPACPNAISALGN